MSISNLGGKMKLFQITNIDKITKLLLCNFAFAVLYTFVCLPFGGGHTICAFSINFLFTLFLGYVTVYKIIIHEDLDHFYLTYCLFFYQSCVFIVSYIIYRCGNNYLPIPVDLISTIFWVGGTITSLTLGYKYFNIKNTTRLFAFKPQWIPQIEPNLPENMDDSSRIVFYVIDFLNDLIQVIIALFVVNIFVFQLYVIPSESMVPEFMAKDRVFVFKTFSGPRFPLSRVILPDIVRYKRGDIVVVRNPNYEDSYDNEKSFTLNNFISTITFGTVSLNKGENGVDKADPLIKRIIGLPGEELMLMDGNLYIKKKNEKDFTLCMDEKKWACWNINETEYSIQTKVNWIPLSQSMYKSFLDLEEQRRNMDIQQASETCYKITESFSQYARGNDFEDGIGDFVFDENGIYIYDLFNNISDITVQLLTQDGGCQWLDHFMNDWYKDIDLNLYDNSEGVVGSHLMGGDLYSDSLWRLNIMTKIIFGSILLRNTELIKQGVLPGDWSKDSKRTEYYNKAQVLCDYISRMDLRNMPIFKIEGVSYFMMGDNRFNSLDLRHSYEEKLSKLTAYDKYSVSYYSNLGQQSVKKDKILGKALLLYWPISRIRILHR